MQTPQNIPFLIVIYIVITVSIRKKWRIIISIPNRFRFVDDFKDKEIPFSANTDPSKYLVANEKRNWFIFPQDYNIRKRNLYLN